MADDTVRAEKAEPLEDIGDEDAAPPTYNLRISLPPEITNVFVAEALSSNREEHDVITEVLGDWARRRVHAADLMLKQLAGDDEDAD